MLKAIDWSKGTLNSRWDGGNNKCALFSTQDMRPLHERVHPNQSKGSQSQIKIYDEESYGHRADLMPLCMPDTTQ